MLGYDIKQAIKHLFNFENIFGIILAIALPMLCWLFLIISGISELYSQFLSLLISMAFFTYIFCRFFGAIHKTYI